MRRTIKLKSVEFNYIVSRLFFFISSFFKLLGGGKLCVLTMITIKIGDKIRLCTRLLIGLKRYLDFVYIWAIRRSILWSESFVLVRSIMNPDLNFSKKN